MSSGKKILAKLKKQSGEPSTIPWKDLLSLMNHLGYAQLPAKGGGSSYRFHNPQTNKVIMLHRPHPENEVCGGAVKSVLEHLREEGYL